MDGIYRKNEIHGTDWYELAPGRTPSVHGEDAVYIADEDMAWLARWLTPAAGKVNYTGITLLYEAQWDKAYRLYGADTVAHTPHRDAFLATLHRFLQECYRTHAVLTLYGL